MRIDAFAFLLAGVLTLPALASPECPRWMNDGQCQQYLGALHGTITARVAPLTDGGGTGCMQDPSADMCAYAMGRSQPNWHWCSDSRRTTRCDLKYCERNDCYATNCTVVSTVYCCANPDNQQPPDWSTTEVTACPTH